MPNGSAFQPPSSGTILPKYPLHCVAGSSMQIKLIILAGKQWRGTGGWGMTMHQNACSLVNASRRITHDFRTGGASIAGKKSYDHGQRSRPETPDLCTSPVNSTRDLECLEIMSLIRLARFGSRKQNRKSLFRSRSGGVWCIS